MALPNCSPQYSYRPTNFTASEVACAAPLYAEHRSRLTAGNAFFRSKNQGPEENLISVECLAVPAPTFNVYVNGVLVRTYIVILGYGGIADLRSQLNADPNQSTLPIEMPIINYDVYDTRIPPEEFTDGLTTIGLDPFPLTYLSGGSGGPTTDAGLSSIRTGPDRTLFILATTEDLTGADITPPASSRVRQWNGTAWISYCNLIQGQCPLEGTC